MTLPRITESMTGGHLGDSHGRIARNAMRARGKEYFRNDAIKIADKRDVWSAVKAIVADAIITHRPEWVIQVSIQKAEELIGHTQSKYYVHAAEWLERTKKAYKYLEWDHEWRVFLDRLKEKHKRRPTLQEYLKRL